MPSINVARLHEVGKPLQLGTTEKPVPSPTDVLVKVEACCLVPNSYNLVSKKARLPILDLPGIFGLDVAGTIESVGDNVLNLKAGDRVYVDPFMWCRSCHFCKTGRKDICPNSALRGYFSTSDSPGSRKVLATYPIGGLSEYVLAPDTNLIVLPDSIDINLASRFGYLGLPLARSSDHCAGIGLHQDPRNWEEQGAVGRGRRDGQRETGVHPFVRGRGRHRGVDQGKDGRTGSCVLYDCLGVGGDANGTMKLISTVKVGGNAILAAGGAEGDLSQTYDEAMEHQVAIIGSMWFSGDHIEELVDLIDAGVIDFSFLEHKFFSLDEVNDAFQFVGDRPGGAVNVVVQPQVRKQ